MRVIAGEFRSRRLKTVPGLNTRPTPDRLRETLFNILGLRVTGAIFLDAYAGTGAVGIEALSRGARRVIFIEKNKAAVKVLRENLESLEIRGARAVVVPAAVTAALRHYQADIAFLDPPYDRQREYAQALKPLGENPPTLVVVQHSVRLAPAESYGALRRTRIVKQGDNALSFYAITS